MMKWSSVLQNISKGMASLWKGCVLFVVAIHRCWERLKAGGEGNDIERDGWMASVAQRT